MRLLCHMFGHRLYVNPMLGEVCRCRCGTTFVWRTETWKRLPQHLTYPVAP